MYTYDSLYKQTMRPVVLPSIIPSNIMLICSDDIHGAFQMRAIGLSICVLASHLIDIKNIMIMYTMNLILSKDF